MEGGALVAEALLAGAQRAEVLSSLGHGVGAELEKNKTKLIVLMQNTLIWDLN